MKMARPSNPASLLGRVALATALTAALSGAASAAGYRAAGQMGSDFTVSAGPARFAVTLPLRNRAGLDAQLAALQDPSSRSYHQFLTPAQFESRYGPSLASRLAIEKELRAAGFTVHVGSQSVFANGSQSAAERYFHTRLAYRVPTGSARPLLAPLSPLQRTPLLASLSAHVIGLDGLPEYHSNAVFRPTPNHILDPLDVNSPLGPYFAPALKQAYSYPSYALATGKGTVVGIISDSEVNPTDLKDYLAASGTPVPSLFNFPIAGGGPYSATGDGTGEATLDVEQVAGSAPQTEIGVFDVPDYSPQSILEANSVALESGADIVSSSIGGCEKYYANTVGIWMLEALDNVFAEGAAEGTTFVAASGDNAAWQCGTTTAAASVGVQSPTDDPLMIAVGGTTALTTTHVAGSRDAAYVGETSYDVAFSGHGGAVWGSGGGYSTIFLQPAYQAGFVGGKARGVPDLAMHMGGPAKTMSGDILVVGGQEEDVFGTSAAAPEFAGLLALRVELLKKRQGDLHAYFYTNAKKAGMFRHGIRGNNGYATTTTLWDPVLGLGTPFGRYITGTPTAALAGIPGTASNP